MECSEFKDQLQSMLDGQLSAAERSRMENHQQQCPRCAAELGWMQQFYGAIEQERRVTPSTELTDRILDQWALNRLKGRERNLVFGRVERLFIAASILIAILGGVKIGDLIHKMETKDRVPMELALLDDLAMEDIGALIEN
ncbi:MAG: zf-HC2 domain-containing protein [Marinilabiliales bacterium]|nr:zf-HC2 domain-containing protein [Marinilabiliales bacterium]